MVRNASIRTTKYAAGLDPIEIYLKIKRQKHRFDQIVWIMTHKDLAIQPILISYGLDARLNMLAMEAWRELYYMGYKTKQKLKKNE